MDDGTLTAAKDRPANPLAGGFYTVVEAVRLIEGATEGRVRGWLRGYPGREAGPLLDPDYPPTAGRVELSFLDLIETRFVDHFRRHGVRSRALRRAAERLRVELGTRHPFATGLVHLVADRADVFVRVMRDAAIATEDAALRSLTSDNYVLGSLIRQSLLPGLTFDTRTELARHWAPRPGLFPTVTVDPNVAYGQPALRQGVPTSAILAAWRAEGGDVDAAAYWTGLPANDVRIAVEFEHLLDAGMAARAA